jgi:hypothetical protein
VLNTKLPLFLIILSSTISLSLIGEAAAKQRNVTPETFIGAETDRMFHEFVKNAGGKINEFFYVRKPPPLDDQTVIRMNRDTL